MLLLSKRKLSAVRLLLLTILHHGDAKDPTAPGQTLKEDVVAGTTQGQGVTVHGSSVTQTLGTQIRCVALVKEGPTMLHWLMSKMPLERNTS